MARITILAEKNCASSAIVGTIDAFAIANLWWAFLEPHAKGPLFDTHIVTADGKPVRANGGILLEPECSMDEVCETDLILLPAFLPPFDLNNPRTEKICQWLRGRYKQNTLIATTCTGTFLLAKTGLLDGRLATTNWQFAGMFKKAYPKVKLRIDRIMTEDDNLICTGAATAFMNLGLHLIERFGSSELALRCSKALLVDSDRQSQAPYIPYDFWKNHADDQVLEAQTWMEDHYRDKVSIDGIAKNVGISPRHFKRRFKEATGETPIRYLQQLRIEKAKHRLERTNDTINEITWHVGYEDINSFRRLFRKHTGMSPKGYRTKFSGLASP